MPVTPITKYDGDWSTPVPVSSPVFSAPFPDTCQQYILTQVWMSRVSGSAPGNLGDAHPVYNNFYLASESPMEWAGKDVVKWTRTYAKKPGVRWVPEMFAYPFIGFWGLTGINVSNVTGRERVPKQCLSRIKHEYYRVAPSGGDVTNEISIPILYAQKYYIYNQYLLVDYIADSPPFVSATTPSRTAYQGWVDDALANGWNATSGLIVAEDCKIAQWLGPIWERTTRYVLAQ